MSETVFTKVDYDLNSLVKYIELGEIGLPDIQRPFVWKNAKVRDLFDSMYRGYPVGYLLLWRSGLADDRPIGTDVKQKPPRLVIVDGQQRLTSLYAVVKGVPVVRENYDSEQICIAFNPLEERFEVVDAAIRRDKAFIPDISRIWSNDTDIFEVVDDYLEGLRTSREVTEEETKRIKKAISKLQSLTTFPFTALELAADISEEDVSDVFVRINSKGTPLNQADFILTLMSVFWDEGRAELERFCREARQPTRGTASPFNYFIEPDPAQLLRVSVGVAFKRARLQYVYSILRGKDLETERFSDERRIEQFDRLKDAQSRVLNIQYWHDFLNCIRLAGFRSDKMISSQNNLLFSYILYLIGRTEIGVEEFTLRKTIAQWFFMSAVTGRYTGSPESALESDLARLRDVDSPEMFVSRLQNICDISLTNDFWATTLPNDLATSSPRSPSLFGYYAAQVLLDARALFSNARVGDLLDPATHASRSAVERHHLYPKGYLATLNVTDTRETNQIANYAYVEWGDNNKIADRAPAGYLPQLRARFTHPELADMYHYHALPENWEQMDYHTFLEQRRELMAQIIREGYQRLVVGNESKPKTEAFDLSFIIDYGESESVEFKATLRTNLHTGATDTRMEMAVLKTLAGFLNTGGGTLVIGVLDDGTPLGLGADGFPSEDKMSLHLVNIVKARISPQALTAMHMHFEDYDGERVMVIRCQKSPAAVFVKDGEHERFYVRTGPSTTELKASETQDYIKQRFDR
ncbi:MAG: DUF262 domain-containing protein [Methanoculleus sp.]|uniref:GmrSD restriction endonuclease domain-containing protein n=2 Tax=Methanoculleus TaxID=45989 RepID=UPI0025EAFE67|nr:MULTISPECIES: DUF262 domain-containing protein [unclassified Methanoculleus]MCK9299384.1 DUF262 domain-containing protein [Methanoculleus sp.]MDD2255204.1 DUF262 domain-containing protein [Methanoculleus sp.]MDD4472120.1 DUF262 domain-containing protein [Methanoculleus sp.]